MAIENDVIIDKLKEEGINESLSNGLSFETEEDLNSWVENFKSGLPEPPKGLNEYTKEELEEIAKDPQFKGAKGLQGLLDAQRQKFSKPKEPIEPIKPKPAKAELSEEDKAALAELKEFKAEMSKAKFNGKVKKAAEGLDDETITDIQNSLKVDATDEDIEKAIEKKKAYLAKLGVKNFGTPGGGGKSKAGKKVFEDWAKKEKARKDKFNKK